MKSLLERYTPSQVHKFTWKVVDVDNVINWVLGISLVLVPDFFNKIFFGHELISHWIYIVVGLGLLWFAVWQVDNFIKPRTFDIPKLRFAAGLAWAPCLLLTLAIVVLGSRMLVISQILLWIAAIYMLLLGGLYWWMAEQIKS